VDGIPRWVFTYPMRAHIEAPRPSNAGVPDRVRELTDRAKSAKLVTCSENGTSVRRIWTCGSIFQPLTGVQSALRSENRLVLIWSQQDEVSWMQNVL